jgi:hypothetical protein
LFGFGQAFAGFARQAADFYRRSLRDNPNSFTTAQPAGDQG